ncbi:NCBP [Symbiodinium microadriaticum]|nr:NCBP [Symbiodinium microadriaticum]
MSCSEYRASLIKLGSFDTVESFWKLYLYLKRPSVLDVNVNLYLFRDGPDIAPMWECFPKGGCWILKVKKKRDSGASVLGKMWQDMVLSTVGELFEEPDVVGDNTNDEVRFHIGEKMKQILDLEPSTMIEYKHHASSMRDMSSFRNAKGTFSCMCARVGPEVLPVCGHHN